MLRYFQFAEDTPPDILHFERLWLTSLFLSATVTIMLYDSTVLAVGGWSAAINNIILFGGSALLMVFTSRRKSNVARWLLAVPFNLFMLFYYLLHMPQLEGMWPMAHVAFVKLGVEAAATYMLFTARSRAWFANCPPPLLDEA